MTYIEVLEKSPVTPEIQKTRSLLIGNESYLPIFFRKLVFVAMYGVYNSCQDGRQSVSHSQISK